MVMASDDSSHIQFNRWLAKPLPGEEVVITGISGRFPASKNVREFRDNLFEKKDMFSSVKKRWIVDHKDIPSKGGLLPEIDKFDAGNFGIHHRQATYMDPTMRNFLEVAIESVMDAGVHPKELEGSKTGVLVAYSFSDLEVPVLTQADEAKTFKLTGFERSFLAHRISYYLKLKGPSMVVDSACSSSLNALEHAFNYMRTGKCDNVLIGGCNLTLQPSSTLQFARTGLLSKDSKCRVFDQDASGYVRGETIACIFLQKAKNSRRIYSQIACSKINNDGFKSEGMLYPSHKMQSKLLSEIYTESEISPSQLIYMELHGTGTKVGDGEELQAVEKAIVNYREKPLMIGSVKSNIGHAEPASGMASIIKTVIAMEEGKIAPNLHLHKIKKGFTSLEQGKLRVATEVTTLEDVNDEAIMGVSNFGFGGNNCHVILKRVTRLKNEEENDVPNLVCVSGRTEEAVEEILNDIIKRKYDRDYVAMLHQLYKYNFPSHLYRGYTIIDKNGSFKTSIHKIENKSYTCVVNFGSFEQSYKQVAQYFLLFPVFQKVLTKINNFVSCKNVNIFEIFRSEKNLSKLNFLGSVSTQIGILETLKHIKIDPKVSFNDPQGKLICAYYYNFMTLEEVIETAINVEPLLQNNIEISTIINKFKIWDQINLQSSYSLILNVNDSDKFLQQGIVTFLNFVGRLYVQNFDLDLSKFYKEVKFLVSRNTPMISPLIKWHHDKSWPSIADLEKQKLNKDAVYDVGLADENMYLEGHVVDGRNLFPATGYLNIIWELIAKERFVRQIDLPIVFENCKFVRAATIPKTGFISFLVTIQKNSGQFEITDNDTIVMTGRVVVPNDVKMYQTNLPKLEIKTDPKEFLDEHDVYKELYLRGYNYSGFFKGLVKCNVDGSAGLIRWENNWVSFIDKMLQIKILERDTRLLYVPIGIRRLSIDPSKHLETIQKLENDKHVPVYSYKSCSIIKSGGIEIIGLHPSAISKRKPFLNPVLEKSMFIPNYATVTFPQSVRINTQIILDESLEQTFSALEILDEFSLSESPLVMPLLFNVLENIPLIHPNLTLSTKNSLNEIPGVKIEAATLSPSSSLLLVVATKLFQRPTLLNQVLSSLSDKGFALTREDKDFELQELDKITILTVHSMKNEKLILFKKSEQKTNRIFIKATSQNFNWMAELKKVLKTESEITLYSQELNVEGILGFVNYLRREPGGSRISCVYLMDEAPEFNPENVFYSQQIAKIMAYNVYKHLRWGTYRHLLLEEPIETLHEHCFISELSRGDLSTLRWVQGPLSPKQDGIIFVNYSALNFKDIMSATGRLSLEIGRTKQHSLVGFEFSGCDSRGNRVMGTKDQALSTLIEPDPNMTWKIPDEWSLEDAATVPVVYGTVLCAFMRFDVKPGKSILIHSATGGVGLAALNICLHYGFEIFVTVGTNEKREFLKKHFSQIPDCHIGNSRDTSFEEMIKTQTKGRGVDFVLNSLTDEKLKASIRCLSNSGKLVEIGKFDLINNAAINLLLFEKNASYHGIMVDEVFKEKESDLKLKVHKALAEGVEKGYVKPLPRTVFSKDKVKAAFRYMTKGIHIGKVLVEVKKENDVGPYEIKSLPRFYGDPNKCYIILGGLGGFGLELADWLVLRGAKNLLLTSRTGIQTGYQTQRIKIWESYGATVKISTITVSSRQNCVDLIKEGLKLGPIDGIFNLAVILRDELFENQTKENFEISLTPKAFATELLDETTRELCPNLSYFVVFSSVSCGRGNVGQTNYGMANSIMERVCEKRKAEGFPALAIQWGAIGDVGLVAKMQKDNKELVIGGTLQQKISSCLSVLDRFLTQDNPIVSSMVVAEKLDKRIRGGSAVNVVATILGIKDLKIISQQSTLTELGMDSMLGNEIMQMLEKEFEIYVTPKDLRSVTFAKLIELEAQKNANKLDKNTKQKLEHGIATIIQYIPDNKLDDQPILRLESGVEENDEAPIIILLPGIEGVLKLLEPFTKNLNAHVMGVQYSYQNLEATVRETAKKIFPVIKKYLTRSKNFCLIGYSFGVLVSLELASILEEKSYTGTVVAIDGSPFYIKSMMLQQLSTETEAEFETMILYNILGVFLPIDLIEKNKEKLLKCLNFDERIETALTFLPNNLPNLQKIEKQAVLTLYKRFYAIRNYEFIGKKLMSGIKLYKPLHPPVNIANIDEDYKLSDYFENKVEVMTLSGNHVSILEQEDLAKDVSKVFNLNL